MLSVTDFVRKGIISEVIVQAGLYLDMLDDDRSPNMQSAFLPELHRWISKLIARHLHACPPGHLLFIRIHFCFYSNGVAYGSEHDHVIRIIGSPADRPIIRIT